MQALKGNERWGGDGGWRDDLTQLPDGTVIDGAGVVIIRDITSQDDKFVFPSPSHN